MSNEPLLAFLMGAAPFEGVWFGDRHPTEKGLFWWRKHLRDAAERDTALLRQALDALKAARHGQLDQTWADEIIAALRERLGEQA